ncbi:MAG TPA: hypothetical protein PK308_02830, partial [Phycisphaerales bacterium]|nr:hypothetical protein [Phycisphaerales bacterium]
RRVYLGSLFRGDEFDDHHAHHPGERAGGAVPNGHAAPVQSRSSLAGTALPPNTHSPTGAAATRSPAGHSGERG